MEWRPIFLKDDSLFNTYTHTHKETFVRTYENKLAFDKYETWLSKINLRVQKQVREQIILIKSKEKEFIEAYKQTPGKEESTKENLIESLDAEFGEGTSKVNVAVGDWKKLKAKIKKDPKATKKTSKNTKGTKEDIDKAEKEAVEYFNTQMQEIGSAYVEYVLSYGDLIKKGATFDDAKAGVYGESVQNLLKFATGYNTSPMDRDALNKLFKMAVKHTIDVGWTIEPLTKLAISRTLNTLLVGEELKDAGTVIDLQIILNGKKQPFGINVKSQAEKYSIKRANFESNESINFTKYRKELNYIRRNLGALQLYS